MSIIFLPQFFLVRVYDFTSNNKNTWLFCSRDDESIGENSSLDDLAEDDDEYGKPKTSTKKQKIKKLLKKKLKKKRLGKKQIAVSKDEFADLPEFERPNGGWVQEYKFTCNRCEPQEGEDGNKHRLVVIGFEASVDHMTEKHGNIATPDKQFQVCSKYIPSIRVNDLFRLNKSRD